MEVVDAGDEVVAVSNRSPLCNAAASAGLPGTMLTISRARSVRRSCMRIVVGQAESDGGGDSQGEPTNAAMGDQLA